MIDDNRIRFKIDIPDIHKEKRKAKSICIKLEFEEPIRDVGKGNFNRGLNMILESVVPKLIKNKAS